jgi:hypothetical protein
LAWVDFAYKDYAVHKQTYSEIETKFNLSGKTLRKYFDQKTKGVLAEFDYEYESVNIIFDATFFGRGYGVLVFRANGKNIYWEEICSETLITIEEALSMLDIICVGGYKSFTIDGRPGVIKLLKERYPGVPIQFCQFHQKQIIRRYVTQNPKTECGEALNKLMVDFTSLNPENFWIRFKVLSVLSQDFLKERNENNRFMHRRIRSAFRSIKTNFNHLFTCKKYPELNIPNTTNSCDGSFAHWKQKIKIHRGLSHKRRSQMINFLLSI